MRMPKGADARPRRVPDEGLEARPSELLGFEPDHVATGLRMQRAVHRDQVMLDAGRERQRGQISAGLGVEAHLRPPDGARGGVAEPVGRDLSGHGAIMVAGDAQRVEPA